MTASSPSARILGFVQALPLKPGMRVLEIGCGPGVAARAVCRRMGRGYVLAIDRSDRAIAQALRGSAAEIDSGLLAFRCLAVEDLELPPGDPGFDLAFALRVGALDGRHPEAGRVALARLRRVMAPGGRLFVDTGDPLREVTL